MSPSHQLHRWFSQKIALPWIIHGPWTLDRRKFLASWKQAKAGFQCWDNGDLECQRKWTLNELKGLVRWAGEKVPYYRELFKKIGFDPYADFSFADYQLLPTLDKDIIRTRTADLIADGFSRDTMMANTTGGSTGEPMRFWLDVENLGWREAASEWAFSKLGYESGDRLGLIWGVPPHMNANIHTTMKGRVVDWLAHQQTHDCCRLSSNQLDLIDKRLSAYRPEYLRCYPSAMTLLSLRLRERNCQPTYPRKGIMTGAEGLDASQRKIIESVFKVPVYESYGSRDCGLIATQRSALDDRLFVAGANVFLEPFGPRDSAGSQEIVVTNLHSRGMPFLRYRIGDCAQFPSDACEWNTQVLEKITGRVLDQIALPSGDLVRLQFLRYYPGGFDIGEYQVIQEKSGDVKMKIVPSARLRSNDLERLESVLKNELPGVSVSVELVSKLERTALGKLKPVVSFFQHNREVVH